MTIKLLGPVEASVMRIYMTVRIDEIVRPTTAEMKTTKRLHLQAYPCCMFLQNCAFGETSICCDDCQSWIHSARINMTDSILREFSAEERTFLCQSSVKQVQNVSAKVTAELTADKKKGTNNLADDMLTLCTNIAGNEFIQNVSISAHHAPCVVHPVYTKQQLCDLKCFCASDAPANMRSILGVDRTFNVSSLFLTLTVFKNNSLVRSTTHLAGPYVSPW